MHALYSEGTCPAKVMLCSESIASAIIELRLSEGIKQFDN